MAEALFDDASRIRPLIAFKNVQKTFSRKATRTFLRNHLLTWLRQSDADVIYALRDITFSVERGEGLAIVGPNGAGKSTLLSLIAGISYADGGTVAVNGRVSALLELGSGFHPDLTGAENVALNASLYGLSRQQVKESFDTIAEFAGVGDFIHEPLRTYSTGMMVRLAFSVAIHVDPDILIIDEALAVGDQEFQAKCIDKIQGFRNAGKTLLCVSHATGILKQLCDRAIWLDKGRLVLCDQVGMVLNEYQSRGQAALV